MNVFKWSNPRYYLCFSPDGDGGASTPVASGDGGGAAAPSTPSAGDSGGSGGGASTTPEPSTPASPATPPSDPWANLGSSDDLDHLEIPPIPATPEPAPQAPPVAPTPQPAAPQAPTPAPVNPDQTTPPQQPSAAPDLSPSNPVALAEAMMANRDALISSLAEQRFALNDADIQELETNAAAFVPKMMARVMLEAQTSMMKFLAQSVPGMLKQYNTVQKANGEAEDQFFTAHKNLGLSKDDPKHRETAFRIASIYRQANPGMPLEQLISEVGPMVAAAVKAQAPVAAPASPAPPPGFRPAPFTPAVNGGGGFTPQPAPADPWSGMGANYDD